MKIAIDTSPLTSAHKVRGVGSYVSHLTNSLKKYYPEHTYIFFSHVSEISQKVDIIHYPYFDPFFLTLPWKKKAKTVVTIHDLIPLVLPDIFPRGVRGTVTWNLQKYFVKKMDAVITDSFSSKRDIERLIGIIPSKVPVVHLAAGEEFQKKNITKVIAEKVRNKYNLPDKFVLYVGDVTPNKNLPRLLDAVARVNVSLVMVGKSLVNKEFNRENPWNHDLISVQSKVSSMNNVLLLGYVPIEDLVVLYNLATAFVFPSLYEGFGLPVLEAMQSGCPVITSNKASLAEVVKDAAYIIDPYSIESIAKGIQDVFASKHLQQELSNNGLKRASVFTWHKVAKETLAAYENAS